MEGRGALGEKINYFKSFYNFLIYTVSRALSLLFIINNWKSKSGAMAKVFRFIYIEPAVFASEAAK